MKVSKRSFLVLSILALFLLGFTNSNAQENKVITGWSQTNYKVYLQTVIGTNNPVKNIKDSNKISDLIEKTGANYSYSNYELISTSYQQIANRGQIKSSIILKSIGGLMVEDHPISVTWSLGAIAHKIETPRQIYFNNFTFAADIPISVQSQINYKPLVYSLSQISMIADKPSVIGSLSVPQTDETIFFILTVKNIKD